MFNCRLLRPDDVELVKEVIERSVRQLCYVDHGNDEDTVLPWLEAAWPGLETDNVLVAERVWDERVLGVASMNNQGSIFLNYVDPIIVGCGASGRMLAHLQLIALHLGLHDVVLVSTAAARQFYFKYGFREIGPPQKGNGRSWNFPMAKGIQ